MSGQRVKITDPDRHGDKRSAAPEQHAVNPNLCLMSAGFRQAVKCSVRPLGGHVTTRCVPSV